MSIIAEPVAVVTTSRVSTTTPLTTTLYSVIATPDLLYTTTVYVVPASPASSIRAAPSSNSVVRAVPATRLYAASGVLVPVITTPIPHVSHVSPAACSQSSLESV